MNNKSLQMFLIMRRVIICFVLISSFIIGGSRSMALTKAGLLADCTLTTNCVRVEHHFSNSNNVFKKLINSASDLPRVRVIKAEENYWHGVVRSLIFRFPDDLEILHIPSKNIIQVRSSSRIGLGDMGVNQKRINKLFSQIKKP